MTNHTYAPMISYLDVQRHEYQADHLYKQIIHNTDTNSSKKLSIISGQDGLEITFQVSLYNKNGTQWKEILKKGISSLFKIQTRSEANGNSEKVSEVFPGEDSLFQAFR